MRYNRTAYHSAPYIYSSADTRRTSILVLFLLLLQLILMGIVQDFAGILLIVCTGIGALTASLLIAYTEGVLSFDIHALLTGVLIGFFFPFECGLIFSFFIAFMSYFLSWGVFGGKGNSWINPVMLAVCIAAVSKPDCFTQPVALDAIYLHGSVFNALEAYSPIRMSADQAVTSMLNSTFLHSIGVTLPEGYISLFLLFPSKIPALRYNILLLISSIVLLSVKAIHKTLPFAFLTTYSALIYLFSVPAHAGTFTGGDILSALLTSGALFSAFFVMNDGGSIPRSWTGRLISGVLTGIFAFCIAGPGINPAGIAFAVVSANCINPVIERLELYFYKRKRGAL
ncbi:MAG: RnfABCDGE type electron transport complex subunit D [Treponema sp.]